MDKVILYYSHNSLPIQLEEYFQKKLLSNSNNIPIIAVVKRVRSVQQYKEFAFKTIIVNDKICNNNNWKSILHQMDVGIDYIIDNFTNPIVYLAEHDVMYHTDYFDNTPQNDKTFLKNYNLYFLTNNGYLGPHNTNIHSQTIGSATLFKHCIHEGVDITKKFKTQNEYTLDKIFTKIPSIDVRHGYNYTGNRGSETSQYIYDLPFWGNCFELMRDINEKKI